MDEVVAASDEVVEDARVRYALLRERGLLVDDLVPSLIRRIDLLNERCESLRDERGRIALAWVRILRDKTVAENAVISAAGLDVDEMRGVFHALQNLECSVGFAVEQLRRWVTGQRVELPPMAVLGGDEDPRETLHRVSEQVTALIRACESIVSHFDTCRDRKPDAVVRLEGLLAAIAAGERVS